MAVVGVILEHRVCRNVIENVNKKWTTTELHEEAINVITDISITNEKFLEMNANYMFHLF